MSDEREKVAEFEPEDGSAERLANDEESEDFEGHSLEIGQLEEGQLEVGQLEE